jgi:hypothetical protein
MMPRLDAEACRPTCAARALHSFAPLGLREPSWVGPDGLERLTRARRRLDELCCAAVDALLARAVTAVALCVGVTGSVRGLRHANVSLSKCQDGEARTSMHRITARMSSGQHMQAGRRRKAAGLRRMPTVRAALWRLITRGGGAHLLLLGAQCLALERMYAVGKASFHQAVVHRHLQPSGESAAMGTKMSRAPYGPVMLRLDGMRFSRCAPGKVVQKTSCLLARPFRADRRVLHWQQAPARPSTVYPNYLLLHLHLLERDHEALFLAF